LAELVAKLLTTSPGDKIITTRLGCRLGIISSFFKDKLGNAERILGSLIAWQIKMVLFVDFLNF